MKTVTTKVCRNFVCGNCDGNIGQTVVQECSVK